MPPVHSVSLHHSLLIMCARVQVSNLTMSPAVFSLNTFPRGFPCQKVQAKPHGFLEDMHAQPSESSCQTFVPSTPSRFVDPSTRLPSQHIPTTFCDWSKYTREFFHELQRCSGGYWQGSDSGTYTCSISLASLMWSFIYFFRTLFVHHRSVPAATPFQLDHSWNSVSTVFEKIECLLPLQDVFIVGSCTLCILFSQARVLKDYLG